MQETIQQLIKNETWDFNDHYKDLFLFIDTSLNNCIRFNKGKTLQKMCDVWKKNIDNYGNALLSKLKSFSGGKDTFKLSDIMSVLTNSLNTSNHLSKKNELSICYIIKVADYYQQELLSMERTIKNIIEPQYSDNISFKQEREKYFQ